MTQNEFLFNTPILLITFNRIEETKKVFNVIKQIKPKKLYISSDGPRDTVLYEDLKIQELRNWIIENVDWNCNLSILFRDKNLGCKYGVFNSIDWLFESEDYGIILEDDTVPNLDFFKFTQHILESYKDYDNVMMVTGTNFLNKMNPNTPPYFFTNYYSIWGWGTWKRAWSLCDIELEHITKDRLINFSRKKNPKFVIRTLLNFFDIVKGTGVNTWDYQWFLSCYVNSGLCITPRVNLIENIGVHGEHTSILTKDHFKLTFPFPEDLYIRYSPNVKISNFFSQKIFNNRFYYNKFHWIIIFKIMKFLKIFNILVFLKRKILQ